MGKFQIGQNWVELNDVASNHQFIGVISEWQDLIVLSIASYSDQWQVEWKWQFYGNKYLSSLSKYAP